MDPLKRAVIQLGTLVLLAGALSVAALFFGLNLEPKPLQDFAQDAGFLGLVVFVISGILISSIALTSSLSVLAGILYGPYVGICVALTIVLTAPFLQIGIGKFFGGKEIHRHYKGRNWERMIEKHGYLGIMYARLLALPSSPLYFAVSGTSIRMRAVLLGTALGASPKTIAYAIGGAHITNWQDPWILAAAILWVGAFSFGLWEGRRVWRDWQDFKSKK